MRQKYSSLCKNCFATMKTAGAFGVLSVQNVFSSRKEREIL